MDTIYFEKSRSNNLTAKYNNNYLISSFNPEREAEKYILSQNIDKQKTIIVIGEVLGYITQFIKENYKTKVITIYPHPTLYNKRVFQSENDTHFFNENELINFFTEKKLENNIMIIEWQNSKKAFPTIHKKIINSIKIYFQELKKNVSTEIYFGKKWITNSIRNITYKRKNYKIEKIDGDIIITAAGPSLEKNIENIKKYRNHFSLVATTSSMPTLKSYNINPDFIIHTDAGIFSKNYLINKKIKNIFPINSVFNETENSILFNQKMGFENIFYNTKNTQTTIECPTVSASAYKFLKPICTGKIFFIGLDLCSQDIKTHSRGHIKFIQTYNSSKKINSLENQFYKSSNTKSKQDLNIFAHWFNTEYKNKLEKFNRIEPIKTPQYNFFNDYNSSTWQTLKYNKTELSKNSIEKKDIKQILNQLKNTISSTENQENLLNQENQNIQFIKFLNPKNFYKLKSNNITFQDYKNRTIKDIEHITQLIKKLSL